MTIGRLSVRRTALSVAVLWPAMPMVAAAQGGSTTVIQDVRSCLTCEIKVQTRFAFATRPPEGEITEVPFAVRLDPSGNYWILSQNTLPRVYTSRGLFMRTFGRSGQGPGELLLVEDLFWTPGDSLVAIDGVNHRASVFGPDGRLHRQLLLPSQLVNGVVMQWPSRVFMSGQIARSATAGFPLHLVSFDSTAVKVARSFGPDRGLLRPGARGTTIHSTARGTRGSLLTANAEQFRLFVWSAEGDLLSSITRSAAWFPETGAARIGSPERPPTPAVLAVEVDRDGLFWVFVRVPADRWQQAWASVPKGAQEVRRDQLDYARLFNTRVEVIDPAAGALLTTTLIPGLAVAALGDGSVAVFGTSLSGEPTLRIDQLRLHRPGKRD